VRGPTGAVRPGVDERALAARAADGDRSAQREVFATQRAVVHRTLFRILGSNRDIEDVLQETFLEVFRSLASFRGDSSLGRWCSIIATRVAWSYLHRRRPAVALEAVDEPATGAPDAEREAIAREAARRLYAALDRLDPAWRIAFALAVIDGRSIAEVAALTGASKVATKTRIWRARRELFRRARRDELLATYLVDLEPGGAR
jgi:RNA polymerase sigma-70 factor (ECF subfamily)